MAVGVAYNDMISGEGENGVGKGVLLSVEEQIRGASTLRKESEVELLSEILTTT